MLNHGAVQTGTFLLWISSKQTQCFLFKRNTDAFFCFWLSEKQIPSSFAGEGVGRCEAISQRLRKMGARGLQEADGETHPASPSISKFVFASRAIWVRLVRFFLLFLELVPSFLVGGFEDKPRGNKTPHHLWGPLKHDTSVWARSNLWHTQAPCVFILFYFLIRWFDFLVSQGDHSNHVW